MKYLRKLLAFLITLALTAGLLPAFALTAHAAEGDVDYATRDGDTSTTIIGYAGTGTEITIPREIRGIAVSAIESLGTNSTVIKVTIQDNIKEISDGAFNGCSALTEITVEGDDAAFSSDQGVLYDKDKTTLLQYPAGKTDAAFSISIPDTVTTFNTLAFSNNTHLEQMAIPTNISTIDPGAFAGCASLHSITAAAGNSKYSSAGGVLYSKDGKTLVLYPEGKTDATYSLPKGVTAIESMAFSGNTHITKVTIPRDVTSAGDNAFKGCTQLSEAKFGGDAPTAAGTGLFEGTASVFKILYPNGSAGWTPSWNGYAVQSYQFKVTFDWMRDDVPKDEIATDFKAILSAPDDPGWEGHTLKGWYAENPDELWKFGEHGDPVLEDTILHAKWETVRYTVTFDRHDGSAPAEIQADYDATIDEPAGTMRDGYYFDGWYKEDTYQNLWDFDSEKITGAMTLHAKWTPIIPVNISCQKTDVILYGEKTGTITATASGGNSTAFEYTITDGAKWQESGQFKGLGAGTYVVIARDKAHTTNSKSATVSIRQPNFKRTYAANRIPSRADTGTAITILAPTPPRNYTRSSVAYISSNKKVAEVTQSGNVTFLSKGSTRITVTLTSKAIDKRGRTLTKKTAYSRTISVYQPALTLTLDASKEVMRTKTVKLYAKIGPINTSNKRVAWSSSDRSIATVSSSGIVTGRKVGKVTITCKTLDGSGIKATCAIQVKPLLPSSIKVSKRSFSLSEDGSYKLKASVYPTNADYKSVAWSSSDPKVASVDAGGKVTAHISGTAIITARTTNGHASTATVTVSVRALSSYGKLSTKGMSASVYQAAMSAAWIKVTPAGTGEYQPMDLKHAYTYTDLEDIMKNLAKNEYVELWKIGSTVQQRNIYSLKVDYPGTGKKTVLLTGEIHAREFAGSVVILKELGDLIEQAKTDESIRTMLGKVTFITIPVVNPDGREIVRTTGQMRKSNANGVDLGRNFPSVNAGQVAKGIKENFDDEPGMYYHPGPYLGSEREVQAVMKWMQTYVPTATYLIDYHQMGHQVYGGKPWDTAANEAGNKAFSVKIRDFLNGDRTTGKYVYQPEFTNYGKDGAGGSLTDNAMSIAAGMQFSNAYGRMVLKTGGKELPLLIFKDLDRYIGRYTPLNPKFKTATIEIGKGYDYLGYSEKARNLLDQEYTDYHFDGLLQFIAQNALGE